MSIEPAGYTTAPDDLQRPCIHCGKEGYDARELCDLHGKPHDYGECRMVLWCTNAKGEKVHPYEPDTRSLAEVRADDVEERRLRRSEER